MPSVVAKNADTEVSALIVNAQVLVVLATGQPLQLPKYPPVAESPVAVKVIESPAR